MEWRATRNDSTKTEDAIELAQYDHGRRTTIENLRCRATTREFIGVSESEAMQDGDYEAWFGLGGLLVPLGRAWLMHQKHMHAVFVFIAIVVQTFMILAWMHPDVRAYCETSAQLHHSMGIAEMHEAIPLLTEVIQLGACLFLLVMFVSYRCFLSSKAEMSQYIALSIMLQWTLWTMHVSKNFGNHCFNGVTRAVVVESIEFVGSLNLVQANYVLLKSLEHRVKLVEIAFGRDLTHGGMQNVRLKVLRLGIAVAFISDVFLVPLLIFAKSLQTQYHWLHRAQKILQCIWKLHWSVFYFALACYCIKFDSITRRAFRVVHDAMADAVVSESAYLRAEAVWARQILMKTRRSACTVALVNAGSAFTSYVLRTSTALFSGVWLQYAFLSWAVLGVVSVTAEMLCLYFLEREPSNDHEDPEGYYRNQAGSKPLLRQGQERNLMWNTTLRGLAQRSIDAASLLEFYCSLGPSGSIMPHYDPLVSTTNDVSRQCIIPQSAETASAYVMRNSSVVLGRELPAHMVTHSWSNLFLHLVAAVIAHALGLDDYEYVANTLVRGESSKLVQALTQRGSYHDTYWVCAFCVNQHASVCGSFGPQPKLDSNDYRSWDRSRRDQVTGEIFALCSCNHPKYLNDHPDRCELNKFDDMMHYIYERGHSFTQVVAVDMECQLFHRAWCVAELVCADAMGIPQRIMMHKGQDLEFDAADNSVFRKLCFLRVEDCTASRLEDKRDILARIPDIQEFNSHLQHLICGSRGLLRKQFKGFGMLEAAAHAARRTFETLCEEEREAESW